MLPTISLVSADSSNCSRIVLADVMLSEVSVEGSEVISSSSPEIVSSIYSGDIIVVTITHGT